MLGQVDIEIRSLVVASFDFRAFVVLYSVIKVDGAEDSRRRVSDVYLSLRSEMYLRVSKRGFVQALKVDSDGQQDKRKPIAAAT